MHNLTVVFDLDGTLVDTAPDLVATLNVIFAREGLLPVPYKTARSMVGGGARRMIKLGLASQGQSFPPSDVNRMYDAFIAYYSEHIADHSRPFPGLVTALDQLAAQNCLFAICTNKLEGLSRQLLAVLGLSHRFIAVCGQDTFGLSKPNPEILRRTIKTAGGTLERSLMVGDSANDIEAARGASVPVIAVDFGYSDTPVAQFGPDRIIGHFDKLSGAISELMDNRR